MNKKTVFHQFFSLKSILILSCQFEFYSMPWLLNQLKSIVYIGNGYDSSFILFIRHIWLSDYKDSSQLFRSKTHFRSQMITWHPFLTVLFLFLHFSGQRPVMLSGQRITLILSMVQLDCTVQNDGTRTRTKVAKLN